jgi:putative transposase
LSFASSTAWTQVPAGAEWLGEVKSDGFPFRVERDGDRIRLITRGGYDWSKRYPKIVEAALKERHRQFVIDGEGLDVHDLVGVCSLLATGHGTTGVLADRAYDATSLRQELAPRRIEAVIPPNPTRKRTHRYSQSAYKGRNVIERMFCRLKDFRRTASRYDKRADIYLPAILLAAA